MSRTARHSEPGSRSGKAAGLNGVGRNRRPWTFGDARESRVSATSSPGPRGAARPEPRRTRSRGYRFQIAGNDNARWRTAHRWRVVGIGAWRDADNCSSRAQPSGRCISANGEDQPSPKRGPYCLARIQRIVSAFVFGVCPACWGLFLSRSGHSEDSADQRDNHTPERD